MARKIGILLLLLLVASAVPLISYAQFGEVAGPLNFNVSVGGQQTLTVTIVNQASFPAQFRVVLPTLSTVANETTPTMSASPMNGTIAPSSKVVINVTAYVPSSDTKPGISWSGILQVLLVSNSSASNSSGASASLQAGLAKIVSIGTYQPPFNPLPYEVAGVVIVIVVVAGAAYYLTKMRKPATKRAAAASRTSASRRTAVRSTTRRARARAGKRTTTRRRTAKRTSTRRRATTRRRRR